MAHPRLQLSGSETQHDQALLASLFPAVRTWWTSRFPPPATFSLPQRLAIPSIAAGQHTLVCAPTGTGKTLSAFLAILSDLFTRHSTNTLPNTIDTIYISPLRALGTDISKSLLTPLREIASLNSEFATLNSEFPITVAQRTGDTTPKQRAALLRRPPHILITTPESLALCLASRQMRDHLRAVRRVIVDELHALVPNKRGTDLALSLERLSDFVTSNGNPDPQRIGLSATIAPLDRIAEFLVGPPPLRPCHIADASFPRPLDLSIASVFGKGGTPFLTTANINRHVYDTLEAIIRSHRTTLIFTNLRAATERVTFQLRKRFKAHPQATSPKPQAPSDTITPDHIEAHHSSLDREHRLDVEARLKAGELRAVVCSTSLELGIDIGSIDRVVLLNSPKGVARGLQRVGRAGHSLSGTAAGTLIPTVPADLLESLITADAMKKRQLDPIDYPRNPLDVLAQHLIGLALQYSPHGLPTEHAFQLIRRAAPYATLARADFDAALHYLATSNLRDTARFDAKLWLEPTDIDFDTGEVVPSLLPQHQGIKPHITGLLHPFRPSLLGLYAQNVGTITQEGQVRVRIKDGAPIGTVEEAFAERLKPNDRFILSGRCVQVVSSRGMSVDVIECNGQSPTIPRWFSGSMPLEAGLAAKMRDFRAKVRAIAPAGEAAIARFLARNYAADDPTAQTASQYLAAQYRYADIPTDGTLLVERVPDEDATVLVFHTMIGRAANEALARAIAYRMHKRFAPPRHAAANMEDPVGGATVVIDDYAFGIWIESSTAARRADRTLIRSLLAPTHFDEDLTAAVEASDLFRTQFRYTAIRSHALLQQKFGRRRFIGQMQSYATKLQQALKEFHPDHLLLRETRRTILNDILHAPSARSYLDSLASQQLRLVDLPSPSPFAFGLFAAGGAKRDTLQLADTADILLAMYAQVQKRLTAPDAPASLF